MLPILKIIIEDNGHGMDIETILTKWLVPSTDNKQKNSLSRSGKRKVQGKKGIGRYAASILGNEFVMETTDSVSHNKSVIVIDWKQFENDTYQYLDEVPILVESYHSQGQGTKIEILTYDNWNQSERDILIAELRKLIPSKETFLTTDNKFDIYFYIENLDGTYENHEIEPFPSIDIYHYRIIGKVYKKDEKIISSFEYQNVYESIDDKIVIEKEITEISVNDYCGDITFDIRVIDRDNISLNFLKGVYEKEIYGKKISEYTNAELMKVFNEIAGVAVIRENFNVRPYGDKDFDWLNLNKRRVNNPTMRLDSHQISGLITIQNEEISGLEEKATREGLKENEKYEALIKIILSVISEMEQRRFIFRKYRINEEEKAEEKIKKAFELSGLYTQIVNELKKAEVSLQVVNHVSDIIRKAESEKTKQVNNITQALAEQDERIKEIIATYQIQASLGKVVNVVIHEGGKHLMYLRDQPKNIIKWANELEAKINKNTQVTDDDIIQDLINKISSRLQTVKEQADLFVKLFNKLRTIAISKRPHKKDFDLSKTLKTSVEIYENELELYGIKVNIFGSQRIVINGWDVDYIATFTNLIENSIHWLNIANKSHKEILITVNEESDNIEIIYQDNGVGINETYIEGGRIFEVGFSTKSNGTGLGLTIAKEAMQRNNATIEAEPYANGAKFIIKINKTQF